MRPRMIFSAELLDVEKDDAYFTVPKLVVECVRFIEQYENVTKRYLYQDLALKSYDKQRKLLKCQVKLRFQVSFAFRVNRVDFLVIVVDI